MKQGRFTTMLAIIISSIALSGAALSTQADPSDNFLLEVLPAIVSATQQEEPVEGVARVKELAGTWLFSRPSLTPDFNFEEYFRFFSASAAATSNPQLFDIQGQSALFDDFSLEWCDGGMVGTYSSEFDLYAILCNWGFPDNDLGSIYVFGAITNQFAFEHFFFTPSTGDLSPGAPTAGIGVRITPALKVQKAEQSKRGNELHNAQIERLLVESATQKNGIVPAHKTLSKTASRARQFVEHDAMTDFMHNFAD